MFGEERRHVRNGSATGSDFQLCNEQVGELRPTVSFGMSGVLAGNLFCDFFQGGHEVGVSLIIIVLSISLKRSLKIGVSVFVFNGITQPNPTQKLGWV